MRKHWWYMLAVTLAAGFAQQALAETIDLEGKVDSFTLSSAGVLDGFILDDSTEVHVSAFLSKQLGQAVQLGEPVMVHGQQVPGLRVVIASMVTGEVTLETVVDAGSKGFDESTHTAGVQATTATGTITRLLHGEQGELNGALLDNGLMVRMPPGVPITRPELFVVGLQIAVGGDEFDTEYGKVIRMFSMGDSDNELTPVRPDGLEMPVAGAEW
jgi:hypothetical protein